MTGEVPLLSTTLAIVGTMLVATARILDIIKK